MEWYYHLLVYPQAFFGVLPSYVWKTVVGMKDFLIEVQNTKNSLVEQMEEEEEGDANESDCDSDTDHKED
jgi:hypothetical protein